ncbi:uncharacterized protein LOC108437631 [Pygocentrus nattereri]|uniref:uncharacterized protein LOC108437631 n=1 Tax=Pygocentrus nattereri TaxID=42514 RepID=UPI00189139B8|nr:uncharacterized protein LOC108437631 [Pygocentrus nattereri]
MFCSSKFTMPSAKQLLKRLFFRYCSVKQVNHTMVLPTELRFFGLWTLWWCCLVTGSRGCQMQYVGRSNKTTDLQSDVLLPCNFEVTLLGSNKTADIAAVWSQTTIPADNLVEISLQDGVMFWNNRDKRIKTFTKLSESGNFSILLCNVQQSDLGLYRCELHEGINCMIAYQEVQLGLAAVSEYQKYVIAGGSGGAVALLLSTACVCCIASKRPATDFSVYTTVSYTVLDNYYRDGPATDYSVYTTVSYTVLDNYYRDGMA